MNCYGSNWEPTEITFRKFYQQRRYDSCCPKVILWSTLFTAQNMCDYRFKHPCSWSLISFDVSLCLVLKGTYCLATLTPPLYNRLCRLRTEKTGRCRRGHASTILGEAMLPRRSRKVGGHKWMVAAGYSICRFEWLTRMCRYGCYVTMMSQYYFNIITCSNTISTIGWNWDKNKWQELRRTKHLFTSACLISKDLLLCGQVAQEVLHIVVHVWQVHLAHLAQERVEIILPWVK